MVLLLNLDTLGAIRDGQLIEDTQQAISEMLIEAWLTVTGADRYGVTNITPVILDHADRGSFMPSFNQLKTQVQTMPEPVATAGKGIAISW